MRSNWSSWEQSAKLVAGAIVYYPGPQAGSGGYISGQWGGVTWVGVLVRCVCARGICLSSFEQVKAMAGLTFACQ